MRTAAAQERLHELARIAESAMPTRPADPARLRAAGIRVEFRHESVGGGEH